jgi:cytochrome c oxidase subunit 2
MMELLRRLLNLPRGASSFADAIDTLHFTVFGLALLGAFGVTALTIWFVVRHHEEGGSRRGSPRGLPAKLEWAIISGLLALFVAFWVVGYRQYVAMATPPEDTFDVYVIGKQWMWSFAYADGGASNYELYVPVGKPVRLLLTSRDVIHSFYVPDMRIKQDAVPGRMTMAWFTALEPGTYQVLCAEYCGLSHSRMRGSVVALQPEEYERRRSQQWDTPARTEQPREPTHSLVEMGTRIAAERGCLRCHTLDGTPHLGPTWAGLYMSELALVDGRRVQADPEYLTRSMMDPDAQVRDGFAPIMPSYMGVLEAPEVAALVALIRSLQDRTPTEPPTTPLPEPTEPPPTLPTGGAR